MIALFSFAKGAEHMNLVLRLRIDRRTVQQVFSKSMAKIRSGSERLRSSAGNQCTRKNLRAFCPAWPQLESEAALVAEERKAVLVPCWVRMQEDRK